MPWPDPDVVTILVFFFAFALALFLIRKRYDLPEDCLPTQDKFYHQGCYEVQNLCKYQGDPDEVIYRSGWEKVAFQWCDLNPKVIWWSSEEVVVPYFLKGKGWQRSYYPDLLIYFSDKVTVMVEIKPKEERDCPSMQNICKWAAARQYCRDRGWKFQIWDENTIEKLKWSTRRGWSLCQ